MAKFWSFEIQYYTSTLMFIEIIVGRQNSALSTLINDVLRPQCRYSNKFRRQQSPAGDRANAHLVIMWYWWNSRIRTRTKDGKPFITQCFWLRYFDFVWKHCACQAVWLDGGYLDCMLGDGRYWTMNIDHNHPLSIDCTIHGWTCLCLANSFYWR